MTPDGGHAGPAPSPYRGVAGKVALITGAGSGIGRATALLLARAGARVVVADVDGERAEAVTAEVIDAGGAALAQTADVASEADWIRVVSATTGTFGGLDIIHNNAAWTASVPQDVEPANLDVEVWDRVMAVNLRGTALGCKHALGVMLEAGSGVIVNASSAAGLRGNANLVAYGASKAAVINLSQSVAVSYGKRGVRCNVIAPGFIVTPALEAFVPASEHASLEAMVPSPRIGAPEDIAEMVAFLASDAASFINGQVISVDGGQLCYMPHLSPFPAAAPL